MPPPTNQNHNPPYIYDTKGNRWLRVTSLTSKRIRELTNNEKCITRTKLMNLDENQANRLYGKLAKLRSIPNRTKMYRLLWGDVYCGSRAYRFGLTETDRCIRCFGEETIRHLLLECPYTKEVWRLMGVNSNSPEGVLNGDMNSGELEIRAELLAAQVFRKKVIPPEILISTTVGSFARGLSRNKPTKGTAEAMLVRYQLTNVWTR